MKMEEAGLIDYWWRRYCAADPTPCLSENLMKEEQKKNKSERRNKRLTFKGLSGAFVILFAGYIISCMAFIIECSIAHMRKHYRANKIIPTEHVKPKQKDVETPTSKTGDSKVTAEVSLDEKQQQENKVLINIEASDPI